MAKVELNAITHHFSGSVGDVVFARRYGKLYSKLRPKPTLIPPTEPQIQHRLKFKNASGFAGRSLADPVLGEAYRVQAAARNTSARALAVKDFMIPPEISLIDASAYTGQIGSAIRVTADDDFGLVSVVVIVRNAAGAVLEQGSATQSVQGPWVYTATTVAPAGQTLTIEAEAKDRADNKHMTFVTRSL